MTLRSTKLVLPELGEGRKVINLPRSNAINWLIFDGNFGVGNVDPTLAQWATYITRIELLIDGHAVWDISMANYVAWLQRHGQTSENGVLSMYFSRPWEDMLELRDHVRLGTADLSTLQLALTFTAEAINSFEVYADVGRNEPIGQFIGFTERPETVSAAGLYDIESIPSGKNYGTLALHIDDANISDIEVKFGSTLVDETSRPIRLQQDRHNGRTPQAGYTDLDFTRRGDIREVMPMAQRDFLVRIRATAALGAVTVLHEYIQDFSKIRRALA